ncbi:MAG: SDR family oxidoreductase [Chromatiales bacterium]|nr:SDR family oxidoreductase [Chromatiales bacterium]
MQLEGKTVVLTGASGGIGQAIARELSLAGARLALLGRREQALEQTATPLRNSGSEVVSIAADLSTAQGRATALASLHSALPAVDVLINNAGTQSFAPLPQVSEDDLETLIRTNLVAPMALTRALLPAMIARGSGRVVNIGSTFGTLGFACFSIYSASKFGLRGFSEALRRELAGSGVEVCYVAPRGTRTDFNPGTLYRMADATGMNMDEPARVGQSVRKALEKDRKEVYIGFPESLFVRINALFPRLVDRALRKQNQSVAAFAAANPTGD